MTRRNLYPFLSCSLLEIERLFREQIVHSIFYNLYTKRNIKDTFLLGAHFVFFLRLGCHNYKSLLGFSGFFSGCRIIKNSDQLNFPVNFESPLLWLACYFVLALYYSNPHRRSTQDCLNPLDHPLRIAL